jgi:Leucine-rich repeat (LRR) protein
MLRENGLRQLPDALGGCLDLEELRIVDNPLSTLQGLPALPRLRVVSLARTGLAAWPAELEALPALEELDLTGLRLGLSRAEVLERLPKLKVLHCESR